MERVEQTLETGNVEPDKPPSLLLGLVQWYVACKICTQNIFKDKYPFFERLQSPLCVIGTRGGENVSQKMDDVIRKVSGVEVRDEENLWICPPDTHSPLQTCGPGLKNTWMTRR